MRYVVCHGRGGLHHVVIEISVRLYDRISALMNDEGLMNSDAVRRVMAHDFDTDNMINLRMTRLSVNRTSVMAVGFDLMVPDSALDDRLETVVSTMDRKGW